MSINSRVMKARILVNMALNKYSELVKGNDISEEILLQSIEFKDATLIRVKNERNKISLHLNNMLEGLDKLEREINELESARKYSYQKEMIVDDYLSLLEPLLKWLFKSNDDISESIVSDVFKLMVDINECIGLNKQSKFDDVMTDLMGRVISLGMRVDAAIGAIPLEKIKIENNTRIDLELDKYRASLNEKLSEISSKYSEGRRLLIEGADEHRELFNSSKEEMKKEVEIYRDKITQLHAEFESKKSNIEGLVAAASECLNIANGALKKTSQVGMAGAFQKRRQELRYPVVIWGVAFIGFLCALAYIGVDIVQFAFMNPSDNENVSIVQLISKLAVSFPAIWGAWFSAKQYSHASQLQEDYAYKVSIAMTYHGYKDEAGLVDEKMSGKLLDSMISQFSENPVRLYQNSNSASVLEAVLKNDKISDIINSAKNGVSSSAK